LLHSDDAAAASKVSFLQANKSLIQISVLSGCGVACAFAFEKARGTPILSSYT